MSEALRMFVRPDLRGAPLLLAFEGWNDAGEAASCALHYVEEAIRAVPLAEIDCEDFLDFTVQRPTVHLDDAAGRVIEWPHTRFCYGQVDPTRELVLGCGGEPHLRWRAFCDVVVGFVKDLGINDVVLIGAFLADVVYSRPVTVSGFASRAEDLERIGVAGSAYEGPTGIVGVLTDRLRSEGVHVVSLWAGLPHYISLAPNSRGALALVQKLATLLDVKIDTEPLRNQAAQFEERISSLVSSDPELLEYVRQLKRREFAQ